MWTNQKFKMITAILAVVFITVSFGALFEVYWYNWDGMTNTDHYLESAELENKVLAAYHDIDKVYNYYKNEENIKAGNAINPEDLEVFKLQLLAQEGIEDPEDMGLATKEQMLSDPSFWSVHGDQLEAEKQRLIKAGLNQYQRLKKELGETPGLVYVIETDGVKSSQPDGVSSETLQNQRVFLTYNSGVVSSTLSGIGRLEPLSNAGEPDFQLTLGFDDGVIAQREAQYQVEREQFLWLFTISVVFFILAAVCAILACIAAGHRKEITGIALLPIDGFWIDVHLLFLMIAETMIMAVIVFLYDQNFPRADMLLLFAVGAALGLNFLLSLVRIIKSGSFRDKLLFLKMCKKLVVFAKLQLKALIAYYNEVMKGSPTAKRILLAEILFLILAFSVYVPILGVCSFICLVYLMYLSGKKAQKYDEILNGVERIKNGEIDFKLEDYQGVLGELAEGINAIGDGIALAVAEEVKSQRLKTELLTNVSHDIRTPLTSIITSIDLLKNGNLDHEEHQKYLEILENKAQRLKILTDDLFEAAKASSGNIEVDLQEVDLEMLMTQGLGEMEEDLERSGLKFITRYPKENFMVMADGRLLWRVIENLLSNSIKYAQKESRVYIECFKNSEDQTGVILFKNVSALPLNISPEELMERFKRGDETRNSEGSGLGLAIAKDLMVLQEGELKLEIDGDLFKAGIILPLAGNSENSV
jgi:signal transduction histidine kinase